jgi:AAA15 family ATPase/GTPase
MIDSITIKNYRNLKDFKMNSLGRVNLITGKNNTGKSTLLEAIGIYATGCDWLFINQLLTDRGEYKSKESENKEAIENINIKTLSSLFTDRTVGFEKQDAIIIESLKNSPTNPKTLLLSSISYRFVKFFEEIIKDNQGFSRVMRQIIIDSQNQDLGSIKIGVEVKVNNSSYIRYLDEDLSSFRSGFTSGNKFQFIKTRNIDRDINGRLWDSIILTEKEKYVIDALKIIEPNTERIAYIEEGSSERSAVIKLSNNNNVVPLRSMGDGINRILTIILALVNADNGYLLVDEFENGLHHTIQEKLWEIIFLLSKTLNIQVFATTHSEDCIVGFGNVLNSLDNTFDGKLIRLDNDNGVIKQVEFDAKELKIATDNDIEIR